MWNEKWFSIGYVQFCIEGFIVEVIESCYVLFVILVGGDHVFHLGGRPLLLYVTSF